MILVSGSVVYLAWNGNLVSASSWSDDRSSKSSHFTSDTYHSFTFLVSSHDDRLLVVCKLLFAYLANLDLVLWVPDVLGPLIRERSRRTIYMDL